MSEILIDKLEKTLNEEKWTRATISNYTITNFNELDVLINEFKEGKILKIDGLRVDFPEWWFIARPSNTEPLLRLVVEAKTEKTMKEKVEEIGSIIKNS